MPSPKEQQSKGMKLKPIKMYTVIWREQARADYGLSKNDNDIITLDDTQHGIIVPGKKIGRPKMRYASVYPLFETKKEAEAYRAGNKDWLTVKVQVLIYIPK